MACKVLLGKILDYKIWAYSYVERKLGTPSYAIIVYTSVNFVTNKATVKPIIKGIFGLSPFKGLKDVFSYFFLIILMLRTILAHMLKQLAIMKPISPKK